MAPGGRDGCWIALQEVEMRTYGMEVLKAASHVTCTSSSPSKSALGEMGKVRHCCFSLVQQKAAEQGFLCMFPAPLYCVALSKTLGLHETVGRSASGISESWETVE